MTIHVGSVYNVRLKSDRREIDMIPPHYRANQVRIHLIIITEDVYRKQMQHVSHVATEKLGIDFLCNTSNNFA